MRGTFFQKPLEMTLDIKGESWKQGDKVEGVLSLKTHADSTQLSENFGLTLALGDIKKFQKKDPKALKSIEFIPVSEKTVETSGEIQTPFTFELTEDCAITEKASSLYILCGEKERPFEGGHLQLKIGPRPEFMEVLNIFQTFLRFHLKGMKNKKGFVEAKLIPPNSQELGMLKELLLGMKKEGENLKLDFQMKIEKMNYANGDAKLSKEKLSKSIELTPKQYLIYGNAPNQEGIQSAVHSVLEEVKRSWV